VALNELLSHPGRKLSDHLNGVRKRALTKLKRVSEIVNFKKVFNFEFDQIKVALEIAAELHDIGKATEYFQRKIRGENPRGPSDHSLLSSLVVVNKLIELQLNPELVYAGYAIVRHHHGRLRSPEKDILDEEVDYIIIEKLKKQIEKVNEDFIAHAELFKFKLKETIANLFRIFFEVRRSTRKDPSYYFLIKLLFSILVASDREDAILGEEDLQVGSISLTQVDHYISSFKKTTNIDKLRSKFHEEIRDFIPGDEGIYVVKAPTGIGKTLANIHLALKLLKNDDSTVVYSLPFINIIEQTASVAREVFGEENVLEYHHIAEYPGKISLEKLEDIDMAHLAKLDLKRSVWYSPFVVTTFVSFLENMVGGSKAPFLHRLVGGVVILDEVQSIPLERWRTVKEVIEFLPKLGIKVILSTATLPLIFSGRAVVEEVERKYFSVLKRTHIHYEGDFQLEDFLNYAEELLKDGKSTLFIMNTVKSAETLYDKLADNRKICFLSSRVLPIDRKKRIEEIRNGKVKLCVSTQVVEAGVDVSFERVVRDIGPFDAIIQASGRCNRNFERTKGEVIVVSVKDEREVYLSSYIYGGALTYLSKEILAEFKHFEEKEFHDVLEKYYQKILGQLAGVEDKHVKYLHEINFDDLSDFRLINDANQMTFLILKDTAALSIYEKLREVDERYEGLARHNLISLYMAKLAPYMVSTMVPENFREAPSFNYEYGMVIITQDHVTNWYHPIKGIRMEGIDNGGVFV